METPIQLPVQQTPFLQQIHIVTHHWLSDMAFFDDEIRFLTSLLEKYFIYLLSDENINRVQLVSDQLKKTALVKNIIKTDIITHQTNLDATLKNELEHREDFLSLEHNRLQDELTDLLKSFKSIKHEIFHITEDAMKSEKLTRLV